MKSEHVNSIKDAAMYYREHYSDIFTEAYHVCGAIEIVVNQRKFRIEPIEPIHTGPREFDVRVYELKKSTWEIWTEFAYCNRPDEASVMMQALGFFLDAFRTK